MKRSEKLGLLGLAALALFAVLGAISGAYRAAPVEAQAASAKTCSASPAGVIARGTVLTCTESLAGNAGTNALGGGLSSAVTVAGTSYTLTGLNGTGGTAGCQPPFDLTSGPAANTRSVACAHATAHANDYFTTDVETVTVSNTAASGDALSQTVTCRPNSNAAIPGSCNNCACNTLPTSNVTATCSVAPNVGVAIQVGNSCGAPALPDLTATKSNNVSGAGVLGSPWAWTIHIVNSGTAPAAFANGASILLDNLPNSSIVYGTPSATAISSGSGTVACSISSSDLTCTASGAVTINASGSLDVSFTATASATGTFANPRLSGTCAVDPNGVVSESNENNNTCSDSVTVTAPDLTATKTNNVSGAGLINSPWTWTIHVANAGNAAASFASGSTLLLDNLPNSNVAYGTPSASAVTNGSGTVACSITSSNLSCTATGGVVGINPSGFFDVTFTATPSATGTFANPRLSGTCAVDPNGIVSESNENNNTCSDSVTVSAPDLTATKTNNVSGAGVVGSPWTWTIHVANAGSSAAVFPSAATVLLDNLPTTNVAYGTASATAISGGSGTVACSITTNNLSCTASGGPVTINAGGSFDASFTATPSAVGAVANPRPAGTCAVDPNNVVTESNENNNGCSDSVTVAGRAAIDCSASGVHQMSGPITTPTSLSGPGTWCISNASISSPVTINGGANVLIQSSTISSTITARAGGIFALCGVTDSSSVTVTSAGGFVLLGDPGDDACAVNSFSGAVTLTSNSHAVEVTGNTFGPRASLTVVGSSGSGPFSEDQGATIEGNTIQSALVCSANVPISNDGHPNTVTGTRSGQCTAPF